MKTVSYICDLCETRREEYDIYGITFVGSSNDIVFTDADSARDWHSEITGKTIQKHVCWNCVDQIKKFLKLGEP